MRRLPALLLSLLLAGCVPQEDDAFVVPRVGPPKIDVDTPELRRLKAQDGIAPCEPATGRSDLPAVVLPCLGGGPDVTLNRLGGPLVVTVWAQYCGPCREELPYLQRLAEEYAGRVDVLGLDYVDPFPVGALELLRDAGATFAQVADPGGDITGRAPFPAQDQLPMLALVDESGAVTVKLGAVRSYEELRALVREHLGVET